MFDIHIDEILNEAAPSRGELLKTMLLFAKVRPLARPRLNRHTGHTYQPKDNQRSLFQAILPYAKDHTPITEPVIVDTCIVFARGNSKGLHPVTQQHGDEDNLRKAICDSMQPDILGDDRWIIGGHNYKIFGDENCAMIQIYKPILNHSVSDRIRQQQ